MNLNVLKPRQAVESAFEKPNPGLAIALVFISCLASLAMPIILGSQIDLVGFAINTVVSSYVSFLVLAVLIYIAAFVLKGKDSVTGQFSGIVSALGLLWIPILVAIIISLVLAPSILSPEVLTLAKEYQAGEIGAYAFASEVAFIAEGIMGTVYIFTVVFLAIGLFNLYLLYNIIKKIFDLKILGNILVMLVILFILGFLPI
jgi:hypothetical protein